MKLRAALLLACMITVPLLAMFSHKVSASTRQAIRRQFWEPLVDSAAASLGLGEPVPSPTTPTAGRGDSLATMTPIPAADDPARFPSPSQDGFPTDDQSPPVTPMFADRPPPGDAATVPPDVSAATPLVGPTERAPADLTSLEARLRALGATGIEWTPAQGGDGMHRCRCRIPADPSGQLQRVFQASAADPVAALDSLVGQVTAWSMRTRADAGQGRERR